MDCAGITKFTCAVLAVDIGGPIIRQRAVPTEYAAEAIRQVVTERFGARVHLISQCDEETERRRLDWLETHYFYSRAYVKRDHVHFCRELWEKAEICSRLGATHFVENRIGAMIHIRSVPNLFLYRPDPEECKQFPQFMRYVLDPTLHPETEARTRPILLVRDWGVTLIQSLLMAPIFRYLPSSVRPPAIPLS